MEEYRLIALDIDGTLLNSNLEVTPGNRAAIRRAAEAGKHVALSTGRCLSEIRDVVEDIPEIRYMVCENGSCVYDRKYDHTIQVVPVPPEEVRNILEIAKRERVVIQIFHENQSYFNQRSEDFADRCHVGVYRDTFRRTAVFDEKLFDNYGARPFRIEKMNLYFETAEDRARIQAMLAPRPLKLAVSFGCMLEIVAERADKGWGLRELCGHLNVPVSAAIAVGDSMNDVEILRAAGFSAAMGNACPEAKEAAHIVAPDCDHDGVAWVIDNFLLK